MEGRRFVGAKVRFSVSIDPKSNEAIEQLAKRHKPELSKSYIVEYALVRLLDAMEAKQLTLPLVLEDRSNGRR
jgi:predicted transcriptional regulator